MEMVGFFIILGALVVVVLRHQIWPNTEGSKSKAEAVEEAAQRMKREMERSADEIIQRMSDHIEQLEHLVEEADQRVKVLEAQIETLRRPILPQPSAPKDAFDDLLSASLAVDNAVGQRTPILRSTPQPSPAVAAHAISGTPLAYDDSVFMDTTETGDSEDFAEEPYGDSGLLTVAAWEAGEGEIEEPEVVVSASVADVADLPLTPEEEAWAAAEEGLPEIPRGEYPTPEAPHDSFCEESAAPPMSFSETGEQDFCDVGFVGQEAPVLGLPTEDGTHGDQALSSEAVVSTSGTEPNPLDSASSPSPEIVSEAVVSAKGADRDTDMTAVSDEEESASLEVPAAALPESDLPAQKIRERLSEGKSTTEIAKEFHVGRGAVELISQMVKNQTTP
ncbi:MAG: hypothetical protein ACTTKW_00740 [Schwartzia sp. (in: firmicutes)]